MFFVLPKNILLSSRLSTFCTSFFHSFLSLPFLILWKKLMINAKIYNIFMYLNWIYKTQFL